MQHYNYQRTANRQAYKMQIILQIFPSLTQCAWNVKTVVGVQSFGRTQLWKLRTKIRNVCLKSIFDGHVCQSIRFNCQSFDILSKKNCYSKKNSYSVFPQHIKVHALKVKPFAFFKWSVCESMPQINSPADGDKWPAGQKESQEAAPSITTMNYSPSLSLNFQRRMIRQRRANPQQKRSICKVWISNVTAATIFRLSYIAVSNIIRF